MYTIGIDLGTTNTKAIALSDSGSVIYESAFPTDVTAAPTGGEMDPQRFRTDLLNFLRKLISELQMRTGRSPEGIGITGMAEAGFLRDCGGHPESPILLWYDQRGAAEAEELRPLYEDQLTAVSGIRMSNVATVYKLCWLKKKFPAISGRTHRWFGVPEWAAWILTGRHFTDRTLAVRTGAFSLQTNDWSPEVFGITGLDRELFPEIIPVNRQTVQLSPEAAALLGVTDPVRVIVAGHDDMAAAYGAGLAPTVWVDSTGTAEGLVAMTETLPDPRQTVLARMSICPWYSDGAWALIGGIGTSGSLLAELSRKTGLEYAEIDRIAEKRVSYPENALNSELTPQRLAKISFAEGLSAEQMISSVYDRILQNFSQRAEQILRFASAPEQLLITGGHARLPELSRRKSGILGGIQTISRPTPEAAAYGAAKLAAGALEK